jgi:hypothetical protein
MSEYSGTTYDPRLSIQTGTPGVPVTWYVRPGGASCGLDFSCNGTVNADYDGSGTNEACACGLPSQAAGQMAGEDSVYIQNGSYNDIGASFPAGTSVDALTKIRGQNYENCTDPGAVTIWSNSSGNIVTVGSYTELQCMRMTDHTGGGSSSIRDNPEGGGPANNGLVVAADSTGIIVKNVDSVGLYRGFFAQRMGDFTATNFRLIGNWSAGWDSDGSGADGYTGTVILNNPTFDWNGCATKYPLVNSSDLLDSDNFQYCCTQSQQCYGDAIGLGDGEPGNWIFNGGSISHNTSDGLDTLHGAGVPGSYQYIRHVKAEGNTGNQLKATAETIVVEDSKIIGNCGFFGGQSFTATPLQQDSRVGLLNGYPHIGYASLTGTGIAITGESLGTGNGTTTVFTGTLANVNIKRTSPFAVISYTQGGSARTATSTDVYAYSDNMRGKFVGTGVSNGTDGNYYATSYIDYLTGSYRIEFTTAPDNGTPITVNYVYVDGIPGGEFNGDRTVHVINDYDVEVDGTSNPNTFKWRVNGGTYTTGVAMTGSAQTLANGVTFQFKNITGHTLGDLYEFTTVGYFFGSCRALGTPIELATPTGATVRLTNNTIYSNGDVTVEKGGSACGAGDRIYSRNNIYVNASQYGQEAFGEISRQFYTEASGCSLYTLFDSDYDVACSGKDLGDCTSEGANNTCYSVCTGNPIGFTTAPDLGPSTYYSGVDMGMTLASGSSARDIADETVTTSDEFDFNYYDRGASWDNGAFEYGSVAVTCSDAVMNGLEEGVDCGGVCLLSCNVAPPASGTRGFVGHMILRNITYRQQ